jgi:hypothetical protein
MVWSEAADDYRSTIGSRFSAGIGLVGAAKSSVECGDLQLAPLRLPAILLDQQFFRQQWVYGQAQG